MGRGVNAPAAQFPIYIVSKSRAALTQMTWHALDRMHVPYRIVIEAEQHDDYAKHHDPKLLLHLPPEYLRDYDTLDELGDTKSKGPGAARNFAWEHSISEGHARHWVMDDNIRGFLRLHDNRRISCGDSTPFAAMEDFTERYTNIAISGPNYVFFAKNRQRLPPFITGTRIYSCNLINNKIPFRWRGRYNEDTDLSLSVLKTFWWQTVQFNTFLQGKVGTQTKTGGNTEAFYEHEGTAPKSRMLHAAHPDVVTLVWKFGRAHHHVDYRQFRQHLINNPDYTPPDPARYKMQRRKP